MPDGPDVSGYQPNVDWNAVAARYAFAIAKVSEGVGFEDPQWPRNGPALVAPGPLIGGGYHFARPDLGNQPEAEAEWFWNRVIARCGTATGLLLALDLEAGSGDLSGWRDRFCSHLSGLAGGYTPGWYTYWDFALTRGLNAPTPYWGWFAWPDANGSLPATAFSVSFQQYGVDSLTGGDINRFFGDTNHLRALTVGGSVVLPPPIGGSMLIVHPTNPKRLDRFYVRAADKHVVASWSDDQGAEGVISGAAGIADYGTPPGTAVANSIGAAWSTDGQYLILTCQTEDGKLWLWEGIYLSHAIVHDWTQFGTLAAGPPAGPPGPPGPNTDQALRAYLKSGPG